MPGTRLGQNSARGSITHLQRPHHPSSSPIAHAVDGANPHGAAASILHLVFHHQRPSDLDSAELALRTTAWIAATMADPALARAVKAHLLALARSMPTIEGSLDDPRLGVTPAERSRSLRRCMLDPALYTAVTMHGPQDVVPGMASTMLAFMDADPALAAACRPILHDRWQALPLDPALARWPALIRARAT